MKNLSIILNVVLIIAVGVLYYLHFSSRPAVTASTSTVSSVADSTSETVNADGAAPQIVYVNTDSLLENYEYFKTNKSNLEAKGKKLEQEIANRTRSLEGEYMAAQQKAQAGTLTQEQGMRLEQQLMQKQQDLVKYRENVTRQLLEEEQSLNKVLNDNIYEYLKTYGSDKGYKFVLGYTKGGSNMLFGSENLDVTPEILSGLNEAYKAKNQVAAPAAKK